MDNDLNPLTDEYFLTYPFPQSLVQESQMEFYEQSNEYDKNPTISEEQVSFDQQHQQKQPIKDIIEIGKIQSPCKNVMKSVLNHAFNYFKESASNQPFEIQNFLQKRDILGREYKYSLQDFKEIIREKQSAIVFRDYLRNRIKFDMNQKKKVQFQKYQPYIEQMIEATLNPTQFKTLKSIRII